MPTRLLERFSGVVDKIYEAGLRPALWPEALRAIAELHNSPMCGLVTPYHRLPREGGFLIAHGIEPADIRLWETHYSKIDVMGIRARERGLIRNGNVLLTDDVMPWEEFEQSQIFREFFSRVGYYHTCAGIVFDGMVDRTIPTVCLPIRPRGSPPFTREDCRMHSLTITHLSRAIGTMLRLRDAEFRLACTVATLDRLSSGVVLFGERGNVVFANKAAMDVFAAGDGLGLRGGNPMLDAEGWMTAASTHDFERLRREIELSVARDPLGATHFAGGIAITRPSGKLPYVVRISSLSSDSADLFDQIASRAVAFINDPAASLRLDPEVLGRVYGLSAAESQVAQEILSGDSLAAIAERMGLSENTVKTHLQRVFEKTGTHRQAQLVKLLVELTTARA